MVGMVGTIAWRDGNRRWGCMAAWRASEQAPSKTGACASIALTIIDRIIPG
jgi:hypothetical protein